jgi:8-amino-7-oxononanoate synthase
MATMHHSRTEIENILKHHLSDLLHVSAEKIDTHKSFSEYGLSSITAVSLSGELGDEIKQDLSPTVFWNYQDIDQLASYIYELEQDHSQVHTPLNVRQIKKPKKNSHKSTVKTKMPAHNVIADIELTGKLRKKILTISKQPLYFVDSDKLQQKLAEKGKPFINYSNYNYLGFANDTEVKQATISAIEHYGTSASASRLAGGEKDIHGELEKEISHFLGVESALIFNSGHATNVTTIGHVMRPTDLIICDELSHNSIMQGAKLSQAKVIKFRHNDLKDLHKILNEYHKQFDRIMIIVEGLYSMDGDYPDLPKLIELKKKYRCMLYIDEAHSLGVLGDKGRGIVEHFHVNPNDIDFYMGTMGKALAAAGGYIAGKKELIEYLRYTTPGFVYSMGINPAQTATALASLRKLQQHSYLPGQLRNKSKQFVDYLRQLNINCGDCHETPVIPIIIGDSTKTIALCSALRKEGIFAQAIIYPAVEDAAARIRLFLTVLHTDEDLKYTADVLAKLKTHR